MVFIDQRVRFNVFEYVSGGYERLCRMVTGTVVAVNYGHKVFHVAYEVGGKEQRTSFKFCDIGDKVRIC